MIINPKVIKKVESSVQLPEYMSAKNFTFNGNACISYVGNNTLPEIIIPQSYSIKTELVDSDGMLVTDIYSCYDVLQHTPIISATFTDGVNTEIFNSSTIDSLPHVFQGTCYLTELVCAGSFELAEIISQSEMFLQYPITINGNRFASTNEASNYISTNNINTAIFAGQVEQISYIDGNDYQVTQVSCIEATVSGFKNYKNRIILLSNITAIDGWAFQDCINLTSIEIPNSVTNMSVQIFFGCSNLINVVLPKGITEITTNEFSYCRSLTNINIPSSVTIIDVGAFSGCTSLTSVTIPENVTSIGNQAFRNCTSLTTITIPKTVKTIGNSFLDCDALETVTFAEGSQLESIGNYAFANCSKLTSISLPSRLTSIGNYAFNNCSSLTTVTILATTPPTLSNTNAISTATTQIQVPMASVDAYKTATNWSNFADIIVGYTE